MEMLTALAAEEVEIRASNPLEERIFHRLRDKREVGSDRFVSIREARTAFRGRCGVCAFAEKTRGGGRFSRW